MKNKKATAPVYGIRYILLIVIFFIVIGGIKNLMDQYMTVDLKTHGVENLIVIKRMIYSPELLTFQDPITKRTYPGIIDINKFNVDQLEKKIYNKNNRVAATIDLINLETDELKTIYINEKKAKTWEDYEQIGNFDTTNIKRYVQIYDNGKLVPGLLKITVIISLPKKGYY
ncbi:hypothetical protein HN827_01740 [archaeon]|jgi:hypothetical protein|nr:hypothetical protein [archaeon]